MGKYNVRVSSISLSGIFSGQNDNFVTNYSKKVPPCKMANENDIVGTSIFLSSDSSSYETVQNVIVDGEFTL